MNYALYSIDKEYFIQFQLNLKTYMATTLCSPVGYYAQSSDILPLVRYYRFIALNNIVYICIV